MRTARGIFALLFASGLVPQGAPPTGQPTDITIHATRAVDGRGQTLHDVIITIRAGRIESVVALKPGAHAPSATYDLASATLMPGLIDAHVHPGWYIDRNGKRNSGRSGDSPASAALARAGNLYATLMAGFTT